MSGHRGLYLSTAEDRTQFYNWCQQQQKFDQVANVFWKKKSNFICILMKTRAVKVCLATAGERCRICVGMQTQHAWPSGAPSAPGTSPDVSPAHRQSVLQETRRSSRAGSGVKTMWSNIHVLADCRPNIQEKVQDFQASPGCLASLGLMQRTYQGSLDMRISVKPTRLLLNWVTTWWKWQVYECWWFIYSGFVNQWVSIIIIWIISYSFRSLLAVWFSRRKTVFDNSILGLSHDLQDKRKIKNPNMSDMLSKS